MKHYYRIVKHLNAYNVEIKLWYWPFCWWHISHEDCAQYNSNIASAEQALENYIHEQYSKPPRVTVVKNYGKLPR